jgi:hypothetical protein
VPDLTDALAVTVDHSAVETVTEVVDVEAAVEVPEDGRVPTNNTRFNLYLFSNRIHILIILSSVQLEY